MDDKLQLATGITLGVLAALSIKGLLGGSGHEEKKDTVQHQPDDRLLRGKLYGMTPDQLDKFDSVAHHGYLPQNRNAILEAFASLPRPSREDVLRKIMGSDKEAKK